MEETQVVNRTILLFEYGSKAHGTNTSVSDTDLMGISVEPQEYVLGLNVWEQTQLHTSGNHVRSTAVDTDMTIYSLKKWARLAALGNPTVLSALFVNEYVKKTELGALLVESAELFVSKEAGHRHLGYMSGQRDALVGARNKRTNRPELVHKYGYDTKFAYHMIRLGLQGIELMQTGKIQMPMSAENIEYLLGIRNGVLSKEQVLAEEERLSEILQNSIEVSKLPERADTEKINNLMAHIYMTTWESDKNANQ